MKIKEPYFVVETNELGFHDFNRDIINPGDHDDFPDGAIGIRVDSNFWTVGVLPYKEYINKTIQEIVKEFWSDVETPTFHADSNDEKYWEEHWRPYHEALKPYKK